MTIDRPFLMEPYAHQWKEWTWYRNERARLLDWQMRTGKTKAAIDFACDLYEKFEITAVLILAPNKVHANWTHREFPRHCWVPFDALAWSSNNKEKPWHKDLVKKVCRPSGSLSVLAVNYEAFILDDAKKVIRYLVDHKRVLLICDEAHHLRAPGSKRSRRVRPLALRCPWRRLLTGTPTADHPKGIWAMAEILEPEALGFKTYRKYLEYFFHENAQKDGRGRWFSTWKLKEDHKEELRNRLAKFTSVVLREDCEDLPNIVVTQRPFELGLKQQVIYDLMREGLSMDLLQAHQIDVEAEAVVKRIAKLQQVASGWVFEEDGSVKDIVGKTNPRIDTLLEIMQEHGPKKVVIWCRFKEDCRRVRKALDDAGYPAVEFHGDIPDAQKDAAYEVFMGDPTIRAIVAQPAACGEGLDFSVASTMIWYSHTWRLTLREQASERCTKMGGQDVEVIDIVARRTVDERILDLLDSKRDVATYMTGSGLRDLLLSDHSLFRGDQP